MTAYWSHWVVVPISVVGLVVGLIGITLLFDSLEYYHDEWWERAMFFAATLVGAGLIVLGYVQAKGQVEPPYKSPTQIVQEKVDACLKAGGHPIVTGQEINGRAYGDPYFWGCDHND